VERCPSCGSGSVSGANYCSHCGAALVGAAAVSRTERKVVTVLFVDLVGFTPRAERLDPEDVRALLSPYYARLRAELERFGGTVEKFIGDAVMALFGAPTAHEDDPERAVRAALAIRDWVVAEPTDLQLRIGINTGEALVALGASPTKGEGMASGDVVNTAARIQAAAPVNGILVDEVTHRATAQVVSYEPIAPVTVKGKAEPLSVWQAMQARSRYGTDVGTASRTPLVGRVRELRVLTEALAGVRNDQTVHLLTIAGEPGIGKSRLVIELFRSIDVDPGAHILWRQGRSLPYGDGVTFWALGEMVKAQLSILESDPPAEVETKLRAAVAELIPDRADARWVESHLLPLAGLSRAAQHGADSQNEAFAAWRRFFEALAEQHPLVLVFEDLHWADDSLLDFVEHLADWVSGVPLLLICTARPELFERRPGWGGGKRRATIISLSPLSDEETARLIRHVTDRWVVLPEEQHGLLGRASGNPLYAEQYARMLGDRMEMSDLPLPETVQGIIAARLDALPLAEKAILQDAAVMGKVFWLGALARDDGSDRSTVERHLHALERKDFVRRARRSSVAGEVEYAFLHVLLRDVAYGQLPRAERADKHLRVAAWIEALGRVDDHSEMLVHHYMTAITLRRSAGGTVEPAVAAHALALLRRAGERAFSLNAYANAVHYYEIALTLAPVGSAERAHLLYRLARTRYLDGDLEPVLITEAIQALSACDDDDAAGEAEALLSELHWFRGERDLSLEHLQAGLRRVGGRPPTAAKAYVLTSASSYMMLAGESAEAIRLGREALEMAEKLGLGEMRSRALNNLGSARLNGGDPEGIRDLELSALVATEANAPFEICRSRNNLSARLQQQGEVERARALSREVWEAVHRYGQVAYGRWLRAGEVWDVYHRGEWEEALETAGSVIAEVEAGKPQYFGAGCYGVRALIRLGRGDAQGAARDAEHGLELARLAKDPQVLIPALATRAYLDCELGEPRDAEPLLDELLVLVRSRNATGFDSLHRIAWAAVQLGRGEELAGALAGMELPWAEAAVEFATGDVGRAANLCGRLEALTDEARDRLWLGEALTRAGRTDQAGTELERALAFYRGVGAARYIDDAEALLAAAG
jgi:class 3 adenylate cyclase/tetratricopeptide (TPR) repeat protein